MADEGMRGAIETGNRWRLKGHILPGADRSDFPVRTPGNFRIAGVPSNRVRRAPLEPHHIVCLTRVRCKEGKQCDEVQASKWGKMLAHLP